MVGSPLAQRASIAEPSSARGVTRPSALVEAEAGEGSRGEPTC